MKTICTIVLLLLLMKTICTIVLLLLLHGCGSGDEQVPLDPVAEPRKSAT